MWFNAERLAADSADDNRLCSFDERASFFCVESLMYTSAQHSQILGCVVRSIVVDVMHFFVALERTPEHLFSHNDMFKDSAMSCPRVIRHPDLHIAC